MAYSTYTEVQLESGTSCGTLTTANITSLITRSDEEIADILTLRKVAVPTSSTLLKTASISLTIAKIKRRMAQELSRANSTGLSDGTSFSTSPEAEAQALEAKAKVAIDQYILSVNSGIRASRVRSRCH
jgi:hypothetical protein